MDIDAYIKAGFKYKIVEVNAKITLNVTEDIKDEFNITNIRVRIEFMVSLNS